MVMAYIRDVPIGDGRHRLVIGIPGTGPAAGSQLQLRGTFSESTRS
jgi:hypothetical protein